MGCFAAALLSTACAAPASAAVEQPFSARFAASGHGDVTVAANTLMTCPASGPGEAECLASRQGLGSGTALNNNNYAMERVDVDSDPSTFDSSSATLALPAGASVQFAGLYYGARTSAGSGGEAAKNAAARSTVLFQAPGSIAYSSLAATVTDSTAIAKSYVGFADVTAAVTMAGSGTYTVANVQSGTGEDRYAGWSLVVAYADPASPPRSVRVYDGLASIQQADPPLQIAVTGLETPPSEAVNANVGIVAYEGDRGSGGDRLSLAGQALADAANPATNVFNSSIAAGGVNVVAKSPSYVNQLGFDADTINADGLLANDATAATLEESTTLEQYLTQVVTVSIELDPAALEPPAPAPGPPVPAATGHGKEPERNQKGHSEDDGEARLSLLVETFPHALARPTAVVSVRVTVLSAGNVTARGVRVCVRLPRVLRRLRSHRATIRGRRACWHIGRLSAGESRSVETTAQVEATAKAGASGQGQPQSLSVPTVLTAANAPTRRHSARLRIAPLPAAPCARAARVAAEPEAQASC